MSTRRPRAVAVEEIHIHDYSLNSTLITDTGKTYSIALIPQGDDINNRTGRRVLLYHISAQVVVKAIGTVSTNYSPAVFRALLVHDKAPCGALPAATAIIAAGSGPLVLGTAPSASSSNQYKILLDTSRVIGGSLEAGTYSTVDHQAPDIALIRKSLRCNIPQVYSGSGYAITDLQVGNLILVLATDVVSKLTVAVSIQVAFAT
jgi:hypothetical protein